VQQPWANRAGRHRGDHGRRGEPGAGRASGGSRSRRQHGVRTAVGRAGPNPRVARFVPPSPSSRPPAAVETLALCRADVPAELVADLHEPHLVVTAEYVGTDPRPRRRAGPRRHSFGRTLLVAFVTAAAVAPLTLALSHRSPVSAAATTREAGGAPTIAAPARLAGAGGHRIRGRAHRNPVGRPHPDRRTSTRNTAAACRPPSVGSSWGSCERPSATRRAPDRATRDESPDPAPDAGHAARRTAVTWRNVTKSPRH
jgi:hypothetical protein